MRFFYGDRDLCDFYGNFTYNSIEEKKISITSKVIYVYRLYKQPTETKFLKIINYTEKNTLHRRVRVVAAHDNAFLFSAHDNATIHPPIARSVELIE